MALQLDVNSYVTVAQADDYFADRVNAEQWFNATNQDQALVTATSLIDTLVFKGGVAEATQALSFPRVGIYFDERRNVTINFDEDHEFVRSIVNKATMELAFHLVINPEVLNNTDSTGSTRVGGITLSFIRKAPVISDITYRYLRDMLDADHISRLTRVGG